jgi:hypothetical protein
MRIGSSDCELRVGLLMRLLWGLLWLALTGLVGCGSDSRDSGGAGLPYLEEKIRPCGGSDGRESQGSGTVTLSGEKVAVLRERCAHRQNCFEQIALSLKDIGVEPTQERVMSLFDSLTRPL